MIPCETTMQHRSARITRRGAVRKRLGRQRAVVLEWLEERCCPSTPTVTTLAATAVTTTAATLNASVNPEGSSTDTFFQYSTDPTLPANVVTTLAGLAGQHGSTDGTGSAARFNLPQNVAVDSAGNVYAADRTNDTIRKITPAGVVTTLAGTAGVAGSADGTGPAASFSLPEGVAVDNAATSTWPTAGTTRSARSRRPGW